MALYSKVLSESWLIILLKILIALYRESAFEENEGEVNNIPGDQGMLAGDLRFLRHWRKLPMSQDHFLISFISQGKYIACLWVLPSNTSAVRNSPETQSQLTQYFLISIFHFFWPPYCSAYRKHWWYFLFWGAVSYLAHFIMISHQTSMKRTFPPQIIM